MNYLKYEVRATKYLGLTALCISQLMLFDLIIKDRINVLRTLTFTFEGLTPKINYLRAKFLTTMYKVYGIPNCDTVKKTLTWLKDHNIPFEFHNYKTEGITAEKLKEWSKQVGWEVLLNKKSTTWKAIDPAVQATVTSVKNAVSLMKENTSLIKRPVIELNNEVISVGFDAASYEEKFRSKLTA